MEKLKDAVLARLGSLDPKFVAGAVVFAGTYVVTNLLGLSTEDVLVTIGSVKVTWSVAIAYVAAEVAAYWKGNDGTINREEQESGNAEPPDNPDVGVHTPRPPLEAA